MALIFEVYRDRAGQHRWRLKHGNGRILATSSEGYATRAAAFRCIEQVKASGEAPVSEL